jgi:hypothetical protein
MQDNYSKKREAMSENQRLIVGTETLVSIPSIFERLFGAATR